MLVINRKNQRIMPIQEHDVNIIFYPEKGLGKIDFSFGEKEIISILGEPENRAIGTYLEENEYTVYLRYFSLGISLYLNFENDKLDYLSISSEDLILDNVQFSSLRKKGLIRFIQHYCIEHKLDEKYEKKSDNDEEWYFFEGIGLTIWFEKRNGKMSDICVENSLRWC